MESALERYSKKVSLAAKLGVQAPPLAESVIDPGEEKALVLEAYIDGLDAIESYGEGAVDVTNSPEVRALFQECLDHQKIISAALQGWLQNAGVLQ